jgi:hypothetical protein
MDDEIDVIDCFVNDLILEDGEVGIMLTPDHSDETGDPVIQYDVVYMDGDEYGPALELTRELEAEEELEDTYFEECERVEEEFPEARVHYLRDMETFIRH